MRNISQRAIKYVKIVWHCGCGCCVYAVVVSLHKVVLCDHPYRGNPYKRGALTVVLQYCDTMQCFFFWARNSQHCPRKNWKFWARKSKMPEKKSKNSPKSARERSFFPEKIFVKLHPRKQKFCPRKKWKNVPEKATKCPRKIWFNFFVQRYFA